MIANTPQPPYFSVIFTSIKSDNIEGYNEMAEIMMKLAREQKGFLGMETAHENIGITISYWKDLKSIKKMERKSTALYCKEIGKIALVR